MTYWRTATARVFLLLGLCAWVAGSFASLIHEVTTQHVVCAEHGEVVEIAHDGEAVVVKMAGPELRADVTDPEHEHGCLFDLVVFEGLESDQPNMAVTALVWPQPERLNIVSAPRGHPLAYAPKTSPPSLS